MTKIEISFCNELVSDYVKGFLSHYFTYVIDGNESPDETAAKHVLAFIKDSDLYWYKEKTRCVIEAFETYNLSVRKGFIKLDSVKSVIDTVLESAYTAITRNKYRDDGKSYADFPPSFPDALLQRSQAMHGV